ncbi:hypothetical protein ACIQ9J_01280 [Streptomyces sp. NPDC094153]|uniref:hypothetical protein n=1 Tax=Streptomyces sp. NPDC094153 TaxID=3366058 RepID=UPI003820925C
MAARVIVHPLGEGGSRRVTVDGTSLGTALLDVAGSDLIEWRGGGPDDWRR